MAQHRRRFRHRRALSRRRALPRRALAGLGWPRGLAVALAVAAIGVGAVVVGLATSSGRSEAGSPPQAVPAQALPGNPRLVRPLLLAGEHKPPTPAGAVTVSPAPGSRTADPQTQISFLGRPIGQLGRITVSGSQSGVHAGALRAYSTGNGASFVPTKPFVPGERVTVSTSLPIAGATRGVFSFVVAHVVTLTGPVNKPVLDTSSSAVQHFASAPRLEPPVVTVSTDDLSTGGDFFLAPKGPLGQPGPMIVDPKGQLVWFRPLHGDTQAFDFRVQRYAGQPVLTWFQGKVVDSHGDGEAVIANTHYQTIAVIHGGNGLPVDLHELRLTPQGTALFTAYRTMRWNTTADGGIANGLVEDGVVEEVDVKTGLVMLEWDSLDHIPVQASDFPAPKSPNNPFDYLHVNSIEPLSGGDLLVSGRNTSAAYEVDPAADGAVLLTLGGKRSSVKMGQGTTFWFQHDVELHRGGRFTVFDDGATPTKEPVSRALVLKLDPKTKRVSVASSYSESGVLAAALGNVQLLGNGDEVVGWGTEPEFSVVSPSQALLYQATLPTNDNSYREYLGDWVGRPLTSPAFAVLGGGRVAMSWNGETGITHWRVLTGASARQLHVAATVTADGFETTATVSGLDAAVQVQALGPGGRVLGTSVVKRG